MSIDTAGLRNIIKYEGFSEIPYRCDAGVRTVGYGTTIEKDFSENSPYPYNVLFTEHMNWGHVTHRTSYNALNFLVDKYMKELMQSSLYVLKSKPLPHESQNQYNALASLVYNIGVTGLASAKKFSSTLVHHFMHRDNSTDLINIWMQFSHVNGKIHNGLQSRRRSELELFLLD